MFELLGRIIGCVLNKKTIGQNEQPEVWFLCCTDRFIGGTFILKHGFYFICATCGRKYKGTVNKPTSEHQKHLMTVFSSMDKEAEDDERCRQEYQKDFELKRGEHE